MNSSNSISAGSGSPATDRWLDLVQQQVRSLKFGVVQIVVHDSRITQIDRTERLRLDPPPVLPFSQNLTNPPDHWRE